MKTYVAQRGMIECRPEAPGNWIRRSDHEAAVTPLKVSNDLRTRENLLFELKRLEGEVSRLERERDDADGYIRAIWRKDLLPQPMPDRLFDRLTK